MSESSKYVIGIDLGTTNTLLAYTEKKSNLDNSSVKPNISFLSVPQWIAASTWEERSELPSFLYLCDENEFAENCEKLPFAVSNTLKKYRIGEWARRRSAELPEKTVAAAKSWLAYRKVDRKAPILPWGAKNAAQKISPVDVSSLYLLYLSEVWNTNFPEYPFDQQQIVLTVPASFDESARNLTRDAALHAGIKAENLLFLEEPQAAIYAWLFQVGDNWRKKLSVQDILLVCDVGGGTTDLTLVQVCEKNGELTLERLAVGEHLLVGGDNMDLALAHEAAQLFAQKGIRLNPWQSVSLWHSCRDAKESLLEPLETEIKSSSDNHSSSSSSLTGDLDELNKTDDFHQQDKNAKTVDSDEHVKNDKQEQQNKEEKTDKSVEQGKIANGENVSSDHSKDILKDHSEDQLGGQSTKKSEEKSVRGFFKGFLSGRRKAENTPPIQEPEKPIQETENRVSKGETQTLSEPVYPIVLLGRGNRLIGGTISVDFPKSKAINILEEGFFPKCSLSDRPKKSISTGIREIGLPFEQDTAITRHLAAFLARQKNRKFDAASANRNGTGDVADFENNNNNNSNIDNSANINNNDAKTSDFCGVCPTHVLLNGGVFRSASLKQRLFDQLADWFPEHPPINLAENSDLNRSVAEGAAFYGWSKLNGGVRIHGGTARSYYVGIETSGLALPGFSRPLKALCVVPFGMEEGTSAAVPSSEFELVVGQPAVFRFFTATSRPEDSFGTLLDSDAVEPWDDSEPELKETDSIETVLDFQYSSSNQSSVNHLDPNFSLQKTVADAELSNNQDLSDGTLSAFSENTSLASLSADPSEAFNRSINIDKNLNISPEEEFVPVQFYTNLSELGILELWCREIGGKRQWKFEFSVRDE